MRNTKGLLTECEVCTGKYLPEIRPSHEGARYFVRKNRTDRENEINMTFIIYMAFGLFSPLFLALCSSSDVSIYPTSELVGSLHVYTR